MEINSFLKSLKKVLKEKDIDLKDFSLEELDCMLFDFDDNEMELDFEPNLNWWVTNHNFKNKVRKKN